MVTIFDITYDVINVAMVAMVTIFDITYDDMTDVAMVIIFTTRAILVVLKWNGQNGISY